MNDEPAEQKKSPALVLMLGFAPAVFLLAAFAIAMPLKLRDSQAMALLLLMVGGGLVCSFKASVMLFRRKTGLAIFGGIFFLLFSLAIALFVGCCAMLSRI